jgi:hypothetical protein
VHLNRRHRFRRVFGGVVADWSGNGAIATHGRGNGRNGCAAAHHGQDQAQR